MIKWNLFWKSLKQLFIISLISCFILLANSFASAGFNQFNSFWTTIQISNNWNAYQENYVDNYCTVNSDLSFSCSETNNKLVMWNGWNFYTTAFYWSDEWLAYIHRQIWQCWLGYNNSFYWNYQWIFTGFTLCEWEFTSPYSCNWVQILSYSEFVNYVKTNWLIWFTFSTDIGDLWVCFIWNNYYFCSAVNQVDNSVSFWQFIQKWLNIPYWDSCSWWFNGAYYTMDFSNVINSPLWWWNNNNQIDNSDWLDDYNYSTIDTWDIVFYFENNPLYRFDKNICYVWTTDYNTLYSSGSTLWLFKWGDWWNVVDLFASKFWNTFTIKDLWTFINTWNINYNTWFKGANRDENWLPLFNANYSLTNWFTQDFSDNLTVPFIWNPLVYYFMWYVSSTYWKQSTLWEEIATYCYYKLEYDKNSQWLNITDNSDKSYRENANQFVRNWNKYNFYYSWVDTIESQSWNWTILDYYTWDDNLDFSTFFSKSFTKFKDKISLDLSDLGAWVLPTYIILFLMAIILFRFLSH